MARLLRIEYPGAYYHLMNRGNRREDIFLTDKDRKVFLDGLTDSCETYNIKLITYVLMSNHLNPIRASQFKDADFSTKTEYLKKYPWSTFAGYCYLRKRDKNFDYGWLLKTYFGEDSAKGRRQCREYVYHAIEGEIENPFEEVVHQSILGAQDFIDRVRQKLPREGQREIPSLKKLQHDISVERIIGVVAEAGNAKSEELLDRKTKLKDLRPCHGAELSLQ